MRRVDGEIVRSDLVLVSKQSRQELEPPRLQAFLNNY